MEQLTDIEISRLRRILEEQEFCYLCNEYVPKLHRVDYEGNDGLHSHLCTKCIEKVNPIHCKYRK